MFKIVSTKRIDAYEASILRMRTLLEESNNTNKSNVDLCDAQKKEIDDLTRELASLKEELDTFKKKFVASEENSVTLKISKDLETITPIISYRDDAFEALFQSNMLSDAHEGNQFAIQLAMMSIASDGLNQILSSFEEDIINDPEV